MLESILKTADMVAECIPKIEFGRGHRTRAQLVFEAANGEVVNLAVLEVARHEKQPQPASAFFVPHAGGDQRQIGRDIGAEPFFARQIPHIAVGVFRPCPNRVGAYVGAALDFGEVLRPVKVGVVVRVEQAAQIFLAQGGGGDVLQHFDDAGRAGQRAVVPRLAVLGGEIEQAQGELPVAHLAQHGHWSAAVNQPASGMVARVKFDIFHTTAEAIKPIEDGVVVGQIGFAHEWVYFTGGHLPKFIQMGRGGNVFFLAQIEFQFAL